VTFLFCSYIQNDIKGRRKTKVVTEALYGLFILCLLPPTRAQSILGFPDMLMYQSWRAIHQTAACKWHVVAWLPYDSSPFILFPVISSQSFRLVVISYLVILSTVISFRVISSPGHFVPFCHIIQFNSTCVK
jgi:hypothetical protein